MPRIIQKYDVDLRCPCCAVHPVMNVHENTTVSVLFCPSCEHAWVMNSVNVPRRSRASANRSEDVLESRALVLTGFDD